VALSKTLGLSLAEVLTQHRESVTAVFIETSRGGVTLPGHIKLPPLVQESPEPPAALHEAPPEAPAATPEQIAGLKALAAQVGLSAAEDLEGVLAHTKVTPALAQRLEARLTARLNGKRTPAIAL
jgi:hypothetical protein